MNQLCNIISDWNLCLNSRQVEQFETYYRELLTWNDKFNLTTITGREEAILRHFADSLSVSLAISREAMSNGASVIDIGSGAGFPGIPLKIVFPGTPVVLVESTAKKASFLKHLADTLELSGIWVVTARAEDAARDTTLRENFDIAVSRAVARLATLNEICLPFVKPGGLFIAMKKGDIREEISQANQGMAAFGGTLKEIVRVTIPGLEDRRCLIVVAKTSQTPSKYPRRAGQPFKNPV